MRPTFLLQSWVLEEQTESFSEPWYFLCYYLWRRDTYPVTSFKKIWLVLTLFDILAGMSDCYLSTIKEEIVSIYSTHSKIDRLENSVVLVTKVSNKRKEKGCRNQGRQGSVSKWRKPKDPTSLTPQGPRCACPTTTKHLGEKSNNERKGLESLSYYCIGLVKKFVWVSPVTSYRKTQKIF